MTSPAALSARGSAARLRAVQQNLLAGKGEEGLRLKIWIFRILTRLPGDFPENPEIGNSSSRA